MPEKGMIQRFSVDKVPRCFQSTASASLVQPLAPARYRSFQEVVFGRPEKYRAVKGTRSGTSRKAETPWQSLYRMSHGEVP